MTKTDGKGRYTEAHIVKPWNNGGDVYVRFTIDRDTLLVNLTRRAMRNKSGRATAMRGSIVVQIDEE